VKPPRNLPNLITGGRLALAVVLFVILQAVQFGRAPGTAFPDLAKWLVDHERLLLNACLVIFTTAAVSDSLDGFVARRWGLQTDFGRIVDPFADKVVICGSFIQLVPIKGAFVSSWMVVVILARELLVDGLRGFAEAKGVAFPAMASGKAKMFLQSICLGWIFIAIANLPAVEWAAWLALALLWATLILTVASGAQYVLHARRVLRADSLATLTPSLAATDGQVPSEQVPSGGSAS
jgi:CDP-diacylglycerol---glycerol-3-phosphate 3-phosphatidyltransferase